MILLTNGGRIMKDIRIVILDCDSCTWFHKKEEPEIIALALGIDQIDKFKIEYYDFINSFMKYFKDRKVTISETYKILEADNCFIRLVERCPRRCIKGI